MPPSRGSRFQSPSAWHTPAYTKDRPWASGRLLDVVAARRTVALPELLDAVFAAVRGFSGGEQADEQTLLVARAL